MCYAIEIRFLTQHRTKKNIHSLNYDDELFRVKCRLSVIVQFIWVMSVRLRTNIPRVCSVFIAPFRSFVYGFPHLNV